MAQNMKPVEPVYKTEKLFEFANKADQNLIPAEQTELASMKRQELLLKMKSESDKRDYMVIFNILMGAVIISAFVFFISFHHVAGAAVLVVGLLYFVFIRRRLTQVTVHLSSMDRSGDDFLWEGFYLKEMRYNAVKLAYFVFFPIIPLFMGYVTLNESVYYFWTNTLVAYSISSLAWLVYFFDDQMMLDQLEAELNTLKYL